MVLKWCLTSSMSHTGMVERTLIVSEASLNVFFLTKNPNEINWFPAISENYFGFKGQLRVFSTYENLGANFRTSGACLHWNRRARRFGRLEVTFPSGRLRVKYCKIRKIGVRDLETALGRCGVHAKLENNAKCFCGLEFTWCVSYQFVDLFSIAYTFKLEYKGCLTGSGHDLTDV